MFSDLQQIFKAPEKSISRTDIFAKSVVKDLF